MHLKKSKRKRNFHVGLFGINKQLKVLLLASLMAAPELELLQLALYRRA